MLELQAGAQADIPPPKGTMRKQLNISPETEPEIGPEKEPKLPGENPGENHGENHGEKKVKKRWIKGEKKVKTQSL